MDAWSSPWGDDGGSQKTPTIPRRSDKDDSADPLDKLTSAPFSSLNSLDASDPWAIDAATPAADPSSFPDPVSTLISGAEDIVSSVLPSSTWYEESEKNAIRAELSPATATPPLKASLPPSDAGTPASPLPQQSLSSYDPWMADLSSTWDAQQREPSSVVPTLETDPQPSGWSNADAALARSHELERRFSSTELDSTAHSPDYYALQGAEDNYDREEGENTESNLDVWAAEASSREEKARRLDREEIDMLKVDARRLISSINTEQETQASFADPTINDASWTNLFGSQGTQRDKLHHLQTPPPALMSSSGALRSDLLQASPATLNQIRSSIARTENRGVRLASTDNSALWQRGSRPLTKADWLPDGLFGDTDVNAPRKATAGPTVSSSSTTSGPGWMQTSSNEARSTSGPSFLASFFKGRHTSASSAAAISDAIPSQSAPQTQSGRNSLSSIDASPSIPANAQFEPYQGNAASRYSDDPSGPDLMSLETGPAPASTTSSAVRPASAQVQGPGLLSRWRNSGLFKSSAKKTNAGWAASSLKGDDLDWLEEQESTDSRTSQYRYDENEDDSFASFQNTQTQSPPPPPSNARIDLPITAPASDPFDNLFGPVFQSSLNPGASPAATSSARSSLSASRMSGDGGMMTINTNLGRASSLARKSAASPLQPPPQVQNKRFSIVPPPRANAASPKIAILDVGVRQEQAKDAFADFLSDAPSQQPLSSTANATKAQPTPISAGIAPTKAAGPAGLTADDLLFFDNL